MNLQVEIICTFFLVDGPYFGDNCIQIFHLGNYIFGYTVINLVLRQCVKQPLSKRPQIGFQHQLSKGSILQYFRPSLSYYFVIKVIVLSIFEWPVLHRFYCMFVFIPPANFVCRVIPPANFVCRGYTVFTLSVRPSVRACVRPSVRNVLFP